MKHFYQLFINIILSIDKKSGKSYYFVFAYLLCSFLLIGISFTATAQTETIPNPVGNTLLPKNNDTLHLNSADTIVIQKIGEHAPLPGDADYEEKKRAWIQEYPEEYKAAQQSQIDNSDNAELQEQESPNSDQTEIVYEESELNEAKLNYLKENDTVAYQQYLSEQKLKSTTDSLNAVAMDSSHVSVPEKVAEHAPAYNDPDYAKKKEEWLKNYPEEYGNLNKNTNTSDSDEIRQDYLETLKDTEPQRYEEELARLKNSYPEFYFKHIDWLKATDFNLYKKLVNGQ